MNKLKTLGGITIIALAITSCGKKGADAKQDTTIVENVETQVMEQRVIDRNVDFSTTLEGYQTENVTPSVTGRIEHIYVEEGDNVRKGQTLVRMDQTQFTSTKLNYANLKTDMQRMKILKAAGSVSQQSYDQTKLQYDQAKQNLAFYSKNTYVRASFSGVISAKNYEDGELYSGQPILVLTEIGTLKALINIPESYFPVIKSGMKVSISTDIYPGKAFPANIEMVYPTIDKGTHTFQVKLRIPNSGGKLRPGMFATTTLSMGKANAILVPYQAVLKLQGANNRYLFINHNGKAKRIDVTIGQRFDDQIEVSSPELSSGDEIVIVGQGRLVDGVKLHVVKQ